MSGHSGEQGFTLVELLVAIFLLVVGITATIGVLEAAARLSVVAERRTTMVHRAQRELERIESLAFSHAAMTAAPTHSSVTTDPYFYVANGPPATFQYDRSATPAAPEQIAVDATNGVISSTATPWTDGRLSGNVYEFVTWTTDPNCAGGTICPVTADYRRVTAEVTLNGGLYPRLPVIVSSVIADPNATPSGAPANSAQNPLQSPTTQCVNGAGATVACTNGLGAGTPNTYYLYDTPTMSFNGSLFGSYNTTRQSIAGSHVTQPTIALLNSLLCIPLTLLFSGCENPDLMGAAPPPQDGSTPATPYCYGTDVGCPFEAYSGITTGGTTVGGTTTGGTTVGGTTTGGTTVNGVTTGGTTVGGTTTGGTITGGTTTGGIPGGTITGATTTGATTTGGTSSGGTTSNGITTGGTTTGGTTIGGTTTGGTRTGGPTVGGRPLLKDSSSCSVANPWSQTDNRKGAFWVTPGLAADTTLTGDGGMTLYAQSSSGVAASATICVGIYVVPASLLGLITLPPISLGVVRYVAAALPGVPTPVSFNFNFLAGGAAKLVVAGNRIGVRVWVEASAATDVTLIYDHPQSASQLQLNSQ